ncbi:MAG: HAMP domain-containing protein, partial [Chloroflexota bacterium]|nr:HAMP domain-containing protein [Chloroflexota bacterium]
KTAIEQYRRNYARIIWTLISGGLIFASVYIFIYTQTKIWQLWGAIGSIIVAIACAPISYYNLTRQKQNAAGYWALIGLSIAYGGAEIFFSGATLYIAVGGTLLIILLNSILLPKKWQSWTIAVALFGAYIWLVNAFEPLTRYDITQTPLLRYVIPGLTGILVILSLWQVIRSFRVGTIRTRLLISFTAVAILLTVIISATWIVISYRNAQEQLIRQLESVATLKEAEIQTWTNNLQVNLNLVLSGEKAIPNLRTILAPEAEGTAEYASASKELQERLQWAIAQMNLFDEMLILDTQGQLMVSTKPAEASETYTNETYFQQGLEETYIRPPTYAPSVNKTTVLVLQPVRDEKEKVIAILAGHAKVDALSEIMTERAGLGTTGETYLVDTGYGMLTESRFGEKEGYMSTQGVNTAIDEQTNGSGSYKNYRGTTVIGSYHWLPEFQVALLAEQNQAEAFSARNKVITINIAMALAAILLSIGISLLITRSIANPLGSLAETATQIASGNLERTAEVTREDEIGSLAQAFNQMTAQLLDLIGGLEERVLERTRDLEQRSTYLEASAEVSRAAASILDANQLVQEVVELISERFGLYYVGLFLVDEASEWATLQAGTGEAGRQMLDKGHRLGVGGASMIGQCVSQAEAHIALDVGEEAVRFDNPLLPETRSEGALPLRSRGRVLGAFTIQSSEVSAFDAETITVLQTMA